MMPQRPCNVGDGASARGQQGRPDNDKDTRKSTMVTRCHCYEGGNTSLMTAMMPLQQGQQHYCIDGKDAWTAKMPAHQ